MIFFFDIISSDNLQAFDNALVHTAATVGPSYLLVDLSAVRAVAVPQSMLMSRARKEDISPGRHRVIVAPRADLIEWARTFCEYRVLAGMRCPTIVPCLSEAFKLLGVKAEYFSPIDAGSSESNTDTPFG